MLSLGVGPMVSKPVGYLGDYSNRGYGGVFQGTNGVDRDLRLFGQLGMDYLPEKYFGQNETRSGHFFQTSITFGVDYKLDVFFVGMGLGLGAVWESGEYNSSGLVYTPYGYANSNDNTQFSSFNLGGSFNPRVGFSSQYFEIIANYLGTSSISKNSNYNQQNTLYGSYSLQLIFKFYTKEID